MLKKIYACIIMLIAFSAACVTANAESIFTNEQVLNYSFQAIAATDDLCIAASQYYLAPYSNDGWEAAVYSPSKQFVIKDITSLDNSFYMIEWSEELGKNRLLKSDNGTDWEVISEHSTNACIGFEKCTDGNILVQCDKGTVLPNGFERFNGKSDQDTLSDFTTESVIFNGMTIKVKTPNIWYITTDSDGNETEHPYQYYRSENAIKISNSDNDFTVNGTQFCAEEGLPCLYKIKEDIKYNVQIDSKYYYMVLVRDRPTTSSSVLIYEEDENGMLKRDDEGKAIYTKIDGDYRTEKTFTDFKYVDNRFYARSVYDYWMSTADITDFNSWEKCEEPVEKDGVAELIGENTKIRFGEKEFGVQYENEMLNNPFGGFSADYSGGSPCSVGEYYYSLDDEYVRLSKNGVYYAVYELPEGFRPFDKVIITEDGDDFVIQSGIYQLRAPKADVYEKLEEESEEPIYVAYANEILAFEEQPVIRDDRTLIPIRFLFEQMGAEVTWNQEEQTATITQNDTSVTVGIDDTEAVINGQTVSMDVPARLINDKTMVPVRFLSEQLGYTVTWDGENRLITIE